MAKTTATLKIGSPEIRVPLDAKKPKSSMTKVTGTKKKPVFTNEASMPKNKKMKLPKRAKC
jgi:hypothetical protein